MKEAEDTEEGRGKTYVFINKECKKRFSKDIKKNVLLVYRATPELKHMFTCALRQAGSTIGVTGEGLSDARALSEANVGFTMGEDGCSAAKDHADVILMDDNFFTVITAIRWGRNLQDNVRKFIQFQMTVNISCLTFVLSTAVILGHSPFVVVQLLWINLIMDVLAAIAFATEAPHPTEIRKERVSVKDPLITKPMMRAILSQSIY
jgi:Ca2+ transporting ATPase